MYCHYEYTTDDALAPFCHDNRFLSPRRHAVHCAFGIDAATPLGRRQDHNANGIAGRDRR